MKALIDHLAEFRLFSGLEKHELTSILENHYLKVSSYEDDVLIRASNECADHMYLVLEGGIKGTMQDVDGHIYQVELFRSGQIVAPANLFSKKEMFPVSLISKGRTKLVMINRQTLVKLFKISEKLEENFLELLSDKVQFLANKLWENQFYSIEQKIYRLIFDLYQKNQLETFELSDTHEELSQKLGVPRPSFSRTMIKINREGIVLFRNKSVEILSAGKLLKRFKNDE